MESADQQSAQPPKAALSLRPYQVEAVEAFEKFVATAPPDKRRGVIELPTGTGKCLKLGTKVLRASGRPIEVEGVKPGDQLLGPDGQPRNVLSTTRGVGPLFQITPIKGEPWVCNDVHVLSLKHTETGNVVDIALDTYLTKSKYFKHCHKQFSVGVDTFHNDYAPPEIDPYFLGLWFGDGHKTQTNESLSRVLISKPFQAVEDCCIAVAKVWGIDCVTLTTNKCPRYSLKRSTGDTANPLLDALRQTVGAGINIPDTILYGGRQTRLAFLAGFLDADAELSCNCFTISQLREDWARAVWFIARSLGFSATFVKRVKSDQHGTEGLYCFVTISGNVDQIPTRIPHKRATPRKQVKDATRTGFSVTPLGVGEYAGFTLDGDGRFLLGDFTVTHNTATALAICRRHVERARSEGKPGRVLWLAHRTELLTQPKLSAAGGESPTGYVTPSWPGVDCGIVQAHLNDVHAKDLVFASVQTVSRERAGELKRLAKCGNFDLLVVDECFPAGTMIGNKPIEKIRVGDVVPSYSEVTSSIVPGVVTELFKSRPKEMVQVTVLGGTVTCTTSHPFYTLRGWQPAGNLRSDDFILRNTHSTALTWSRVNAITNIDPRTVPGGFVYNFEVADTHTYVANGFVVHNCHHSSAPSYRKVIDYVDQDRTLPVLGLSATPGWDNIGDVMDEAVYSLELEKALKDKWLCGVTNPVRYRIPGFDLNKVRTTAGDFNGKDLEHAMLTAHVSMHTAKAIQEHASNRRSIIFCALKWQATETGKELTKLGIPNGVITEDTDSETRRQLIHDAHTGKLRALVGVTALTEGFDCPPIDCVVIARPTKSGILYRQMLGRVLRLSPGKQDALVIDITGAYSKHGLFGAPEIIKLSYQKSAAEIAAEEKSKAAERLRKLLEEEEERKQTERREKIERAKEADMKRIREQREQAVAARQKLETIQDAFQRQLDEGLRDWRTRCLNLATKSATAYEDTRAKLAVDGTSWVTLPKPFEGSVLSQFQHMVAVLYNYNQQAWVVVSMPQDVCANQSIKNYGSRQTKDDAKRLANQVLKNDLPGGEPGYLVRAGKWRHQAMSDAQRNMVIREFGSANPLIGRGMASDYMLILKATDAFAPYVIGNGWLPKEERAQPPATPTTTTADQPRPIPANSKISGIASLLAR